jgi:tRNA G18 (ribose-2'-O)-methylase SpoU
VLRIDDPDDPRLDDYRHLTDAAARRSIESGGAAHGIFVVEGPLALDQLRASGHRVRSVLVTPTRADSMGDRLEGLGPVLVAERAVLAAACGYDVHRGVLAAAERPAPRSAAEVVQGAARVLVLEGVNDNENVGALFRNAAALGIQAVLLDSACTDPLYRRSIRVSSGWTLRIPYARGDSTGALLTQLGSAGFRTVALTPASDALDVDRAAADGLLDAPVALVVGAEGPGLSPASLGAADHAVRVPMAPGVDSLNVATSVAVVGAFAAARRGWT